MKRLIQLEEFALFALATLGMNMQPLDFPWWIWILLFLSPDIGMIGYLMNATVGATTYNIFHHRFIGVALLVSGYFLPDTYLLLVGLIILGHASFDRMLGYGLKYSDDFKHTHLGKAGKY